MRVRITFTVDADDDLREALGHYYGIEKASAQEVRAFFLSNGEGGFDLLADEARLLAERDED